MRSSLWRRREFLHSALLCAPLARFALFAGSGAAAAPACVRSEDLVAVLSDFYRDPESAKQVGRVYLATRPGATQVSQLVSELATGDSGALHAVASDRNRLRKHLQRQHREDFRLDRIVLVGGWILSLTEARLCALATLRADGRDARS